MQYTTSGPGGRWLYTVAGWQDDGILALTTDSSGATIALVADSSYATPPSAPNIVLRKLDSSGRLIWERAFQGTAPIYGGNGLGTDASGNIYLLWASNCADFGCRGTIDFGGGPTRAGALVKLNPTGAFIWQRNAIEDAADLAVNAKGEAVFKSWIYIPYGSFRDVVKIRPDGSTAWTRGSYDVSRVGIDPEGNVLVGGHPYPGDPFFDVMFATPGPVVAKLAASDGANVWVEQLAPVSGYVSGIGSSAAGTVVVGALIVGPFSFAGQSFDTGGSYLLVLESAGAQRFARRLPDADGVIVAVDPPGKVSLVGNLPSIGYTPQPGFIVTWYNLAGDYIGQLEFPASTESGDVFAHAVAIASDHSTVVGGYDLGVTNGSVFGVPGPVATAGPGQHAFVVGGLFRAGSPVFIDEFNRTSLGPNWRVTFGSFIDDGSAARGTSPQSYAFWTGVPGPNDSAELTVSTPRNLGVMARAQVVPDRDHYTAYVDMSGYIRIARRRNYVYSYLAIGPRFPSGSHTLAITAAGTTPVTLSVQLDGAVVLTYTDSSSSRLTAAGKVGMFDYNGLSQPIDSFRVIRR